VWGGISEHCLWSGVVGQTLEHLGYIDRYVLCCGLVWPECGQVLFVKSTLKWLLRCEWIIDEGSICRAHPEVAIEAKIGLL